MAELETSVAIADMNREAKYMQILSLVVRSFFFFFSYYISRFAMT